MVPGVFGADSICVPSSGSASHSCVGCKIPIQYINSERCILDAMTPWTWWSRRYQFNLHRAHWGQDMLKARPTVDPVTGSARRLHSRPPLSYSSMNIISTVSDILMTLAEICFENRLVEHDILPRSPLYVDSDLQSPWYKRGPRVSLCFCFSAVRRICPWSDITEIGMVTHICHTFFTEREIYRCSSRCKNISNKLGN